MNDLRPWPHPCFRKLLELVHDHPELSYAQVAKIIGEMPEARAANMVPTSSSVSGKIWRWRKRAGIAQRPNEIGQSQKQSAHK